MLTIGTKQTDPYWLDGDDALPAALALPGVKVQVKPITVAMRLAAREAVRQSYQSNPDDPMIRFEAEASYVRALARYGIVAWRGVVDADGKDLAVTAENVDRAMANEVFYTFMERTYALAAMQMEAEKNALSPSRNGTGGAKTPVRGTAAIVRRRARTAHTA